MITREEAVELARSWSAGRWSRHEREVGSVHEFELGWVVRLLPAIPKVPAAEVLPNGPQLVIDRETGDLARWPSMPAEAIAEKYVALKALGDRFPPDVRMALEHAGWFPGRDISAAVDQWEVDFAEQVAGMTFFPAARTAMSEFGRLSIPQAVAPDDSYHSHIFPTRGGIATDRWEGFLEEYEHLVFPLGNNADGPAELVIDEQGRVFFLHWAQDFYLGATIDEALVSLIRWNDWPDVYSSIWENDNGKGQPPSARMNE
jgi:hypothetical protein